MKKGLKYTLVSLGSLVVLAGVGLGIMYVVSPYKVKRWLGIVSSNPHCSHPSCNSLISNIQIF
ncbi:hypothetical protein [Segatella copri]|uniref:hypothetical protein n=1 Tax=Segatella copri TaxID=165179 RepID=UPI003F8BE71E